MLRSKSVYFPARKIGVFILITVLFCLGLTPGKIEPADILFINGNIYTVNEKQPRAEAVAVKLNKILFVGSTAEAERYRSPGTRVIDLRGKTVVPGLTDSHVHLAGVGAREVTLNLEGTRSLEELVARIKARVDMGKNVNEPPTADPAGPSGAVRWVTGRGWIETFWKPPIFPTRYDLDKVSPHNPVFITRADGHGAVANSEALRIAGINRTTLNPFGGEILRDKTSGEPTGMLLDAAQELVTRKIPARTQKEMEEALLLGVKRSIQLGWCEIQNAGSLYSDVDVLRRLYEEGRIKLRIYNAIYGPGPDAARLLREGPDLGAFGDRFTIRTIKVVFDGALGSRGAALLAPYSDAETSGFLREKPEELLPMFKQALRRGIQVETHAIGDRANREILDLYQTAFDAVPLSERKIPEPRWRVEHAQILSSTDIPRFAKLGIIASMQPSHAISDLFFAPGRLGLDRLAGAYAWKSLIKSGATVIGGSDAPVERGEPMIEFYAAVARRGQNGFQGAGWHPEQAVTREQALKMFTLWAAYAAFQEHEKGSLEVGKLADMTVLSSDIMKISEAEILNTHCEMTVIDGEVVFDATKS